MSHMVFVRLELRREFVVANAGHYGGPRYTSKSEQTIIFLTVGVKLKKSFLNFFIKVFILQNKLLICVSKRDRQYARLT